MTTFGVPERAPGVTLAALMLLDERPRPASAPSLVPRRAWHVAMAVTGICVRNVSLHTSLPQLLQRTQRHRYLIGWRTGIILHCSMRALLRYCHLPFNQYHACGLGRRSTDSTYRRRAATPFCSQFAPAEKRDGTGRPSARPSQHARLPSTFSFISVCPLSARAFAWSADVAAAARPAPVHRPCHAAPALQPTHLHTGVFSVAANCMILRGRAHGCPFYASDTHLHTCLLYTSPSPRD